MSLPSPLLKGEAISKDTIVWSWDNNGCSHNVYDENGDIIAQVGLNVNEYIEKNLKPGTKYIRKIKSFNATEISNFSNTVSVTTKTTQNENSFLIPFKEDYTNTFNITNTNVIKERLEAFTNGVGDKYDLKIFKQDIGDYNQTFNLIGKIYGKYFKNITSYQRVRLNYRIKATGKYEEETCNGYVKLKLSATTSDKIKIRVYRYAVKNINIKTKVECKVSYYENINGIWTPKSKTISSNIFTTSLPASATYTANGNASLNTKNNVLVSSQPIKTMMWNVAMSDRIIKSSYDNNMTVTLFDYKILDDYSFDTNSNRYSPTASRPFKEAYHGTVIAHSSSKSQLDLNSGLYLSGYSEGQLFDCEKIIEKNIEGNNSEVVVLTKKEIENMIPKCISSRNYSFDGDSSSIITKIEILEKGSTVKILVNDLTKSNVVVVSANTFFETPVLTYNFDYATRNYYLSTENLFSNMLKDYLIKYKYSLNIIECTSNIIMNGKTKLSPNYTTSWTDDFMSGLSLEATTSLVECIWEDIYPQYPNEGLHGVVNTIDSLNGEFVKKDLIVQAPEIYIPQEMYDVKFKLITENINPQDAHLVGNFLNQEEDGYTRTNGDFIVFSSDATKPTVKEIKDLLSISNLDLITLTDTTTKNLTVKINKPSITDLQNQIYTSYEILLETDSNDVVISDYNLNINFDDNNSSILNYKCKVMRDATSRWNPYIHNGYYYLNQYEYFLFSQTNINGTYTNNYKYKKRNVNYSIVVDLVNNKDIAEKVNIIFNKQEDYDIKLDSDVIYSSKGLEPKPISETKYCKKYSNVEYTLPQISLDKKATSYGPLTFNVTHENQIKLLGRSINDNGVWSNWVEIKNDEVPKFPLSYKMELKIDFTPNAKYSNKEIEENLTNAYNFNNEIEVSLSNNVTFASGVLECNSKDNNAIFQSKIIDYVNKTSVKIGSYYTCSNTNESYYVNIHVAGAETYDEVMYNPKWIFMDGNAVVTARFIRYRIEFTKNIKIVSIHKTINTLVNSSDIAKINNINFVANINAEELVDKTITIDKVSEIECDTNEHIVIHNVKDIINPVIKSYGYDEDNIGNVEIVSSDEDFEIRKKENVIDFNKELISNIFEGYYRISNLTNSYPSLIEELNYWTFDNNEKELSYNYNSASFVGLVSPVNYTNYVFGATLKSNIKTDKHICLIIGYYKDYYGKEYTLSVLVSPGFDSYKVVYNYMQNSQKTILDKRDLIINNTDFMYWNQLDKGIRVNVVREKNIITITRSQENQIILDDNSAITVNLDEYPQLAIFKNSSSIGFGTYSNKAKFSNLLISSNDLINSSVIIKSKEKEIEHTDGEYLLVSDNKINISPFPQQYSPIIVKTDEYGELKRIFYRNEDGEYSLDIKESYYKNTNNTYVLTEKNIDLESVKVLLDNKEYKEYDIKQNILNLNSDLDIEYEIIEVVYRVINSFIANYNYYGDNVLIDIHTEMPLEKAIVKYETNLTDNRKELKNICLNPIYNTDSKGFIYISNNDNKVNKINIHCNPKTVIANGIDHVYMYFEALDELDNPVQGLELDSHAVNGTLIAENNITDQNGIVCAKYISTNKELYDTVKVYEKTNMISNEVCIFNMGV